MMNIVAARMDHIGAVLNNIAAGMDHIGAGLNNIAARMDHIGAALNNIAARKDHIGAVLNIIATTMSHIDTMLNNIVETTSHIGVVLNNMNAWMGRDWLLMPSAAGAPQFGGAGCDLCLETTLPFVAVGIPRLHQLITRQVLSGIGLPAPMPRLVGDAVRVVARVA